MQIYLKHPVTGQKKKTKVGWSWTSFFFGFWVPLLRGDWKWATISFLIQWPLGLATLGISGLILAFVLGSKYNGWYLDGLYEQGYEQITDAQYWQRPGAPIIEAS
jgi:hypothetical protein